MSTKIFLKLKLNLGRLGIALCQPLCHHYAYGKNICVSEQKMPMWVWVAVNGVHKSRWGENGACSSIMYPITWWSWIGRIHHPPYIRRITHPSFTQKQIGQVNHQGNGATHFLDFFLKGQVLSFMFPEGEPPIPPVVRYRLSSSVKNGLYSSDHGCFNHHGLYSPSILVLRLHCNQNPKTSWCNCPDDACHLVNNHSRDWCRQ